MSSLPPWAIWQIVVPLVLLSPVIAFLLALTAEIAVWAFGRCRGSGVGAYRRGIGRPTPVVQTSARTAARAIRRGVNRRAGLA
jgi:hypothetical protein